MVGDRGHHLEGEPFFRADFFAALSFPFVGSLRGSTFRKASRAWLKDRGLGAGGFRGAVLGMADSFDVHRGESAGEVNRTPGQKILGVSQES